MDFIAFFRDNLWLAWLIVAGIFLLVEIETTALVSLWFVLGAVVSAGIAVFFDNIILQLAIFFVSSFLFLMIFRYLYKGKLKANDNENIDYTPVGKVAIVCQEINNFDGKVKVDDVYWKAICKNGEIYVGEKVKISSISGTTLIVEKI